MVRRAIVVLLTPLIACGTFGTKQMDFDEAKTRLIELVDGALDAGLEREKKPDPTPLGQYPCTDELIGPTSEVRAAFDYEFEYTLLDNSEGFVERATEFWEKEGLKINNRDDSEAYRRFAVSDDGFSLTVQANRSLNQVSIGGSGPCVDPPD